MHLIDLGSLHVIDLLLDGSCIVGAGTTASPVHDTTRRVPIVGRTAIGMLDLVAKAAVPLGSVAHETGVKIHISYFGQDVVVALAARPSLAEDVALLETVVCLAGNKGWFAFKCFLKRQPAFMLHGVLRVRRFELWAEKAKSAVNIVGLNCSHFCRCRESV